MLPNSVLLHAPIFIVFHWLFAVCVPFFFGTAIIVDNWSLLPFHFSSLFYGAIQRICKNVVAGFREGKIPYAKRKLHLNTSQYAKATN